MAGESKEVEKVLKVVSSLQDKQQIQQECRVSKQFDLIKEQFEAYIESNLPALKITQAHAGVLLLQGPEKEVHADDTAIVGLLKDNSSITAYHQSITDFTLWCSDNYLQLNTDKTKELVIHASKSPPGFTHITIHGQPVEQVSTFKYLGLTIDNKLNFNEHVTITQKRAQQRLDVYSYPYVENTLQMFRTVCGNLSAEMVDNKVASGKIFTTLPGGFSCKAIMHVCGLRDPAVIKTLAKEIVVQCERGRYRSVAIPAICAGKGGLDPSVVARSILEGVKQATSFGHGAYFAVKASYSANSTYVVPAEDGTQVMFVARVFTGYHTQGQADMRTPPVRVAPDDLYDSVVDNTLNPSMFVVFHDCQAYPDYLITFK
ncbi:poly [ADP-ribose] polymerase 15-like protein [Labeo rohita]|uniref:Poly [ADP-ribose] polymerase n=1 Tax=Labeo rohita TaxID=84645 RepID=A0A498M6B4_LABRO|nr:poly [ADP-ribose] polymerase 15-like protein [Labeo rohita]